MDLCHSRGISFVYVTLLSIYVLRPNIGVIELKKAVWITLLRRIMLGGERNLPYLPYTHVDVRVIGLQVPFYTNPCPTDFWHAAFV